MIDVKTTSTFFISLLAVLLLAYSIHNPIAKSESEHLDLSKSVPVLEDGTYLRINDNSSHLYRRDVYGCKKGTPCQQDACCGSFFGGNDGVCGLGPTFCGSDCDSKCNAKAECGQFAEPPGKNCPLNVCCSQYGFCGSTENFCKTGCQSNCETIPTVPDGKANKSVLENKVIGYYASWAAQSKCHSVMPDQIPFEGLTHVNYAFASVDAKDYHIVPMNGDSAGLYAETTDVKASLGASSDLKVFISIGGWTFSDNNTDTQPLLSLISADHDKRQQFADNVVNFMKHYGFDGIDIDWEYPGAPDRGGLLQYDTVNYVELMKTLRQTFDSSDHGKYGLSFTIPSSYWYMRWFDLPGLLQYADWTNLMSYDLHGTWDATNPIGSVIQAHTNLTEIKETMNLLWRNKVRPEQVILGLGFYGRSFQLNDTACDKPGCLFKGPADAGSCTANPGTLAYFEIMDIIDKEKPSINYDKDAAAKYFTFGNNKDQWISFDDKDTFKDKVDWANSLGLGGVMIWSVDQDDNSYSALEGLLGRKVSDLSNSLQRKQYVDANHWSSLNGQGCVITDCETLDFIPPSGFAIVSNGAYPDTCDRIGDVGYQKYVYCPVNASPSQCVWRGSGSCHGQCHEGEVTLAHSPHGSESCLAPGMQALCCVSNTWSALVSKCGWADCGGRCPSDAPNTVITRTNGFFNPCIQPFCCPYPFESCHFVGQGTCDDNECGATDVEVALDDWGDNHQKCVSVNRRKSLCCNAPKNLNFFLPAPLEDLFPTLPPAEYIPAYDQQTITKLPSSKNDGNDNDAFFLVIIDGPAKAVSNLNKRDGSHIQFVTGPVHHGQASQTAHVVCTDDSEASNCDDIHLGGLEGTIIRLPDELGFAQWGVAHTLRPSNYSYPDHLMPRASTDSRVMELEYSYNFSKVKRDGGDVYFRVDYSSTHDYYSQIVQGAHQKRNLQRRFWSKIVDAWKKLYSSLRSSSATPTLGDSSVDVLIVGDGGSTKNCASGDGFLSLRFVGSLHTTMSWGYTIVGRIFPFVMEEAYGWFDPNLVLSGELRFDGKGFIDLGSVAGMERSLLQRPMTRYGASHPGLVSFEPELDVSVSLVGSGEIDGKFSVFFEAGSSKTLTMNVPPQSLGNPDGDTLHTPVQNPGSGKLWVKNKAYKTLFGVNLSPEARMDIKLFGYGSTFLESGVLVSARTPNAIRIVGDSGVGAPAVLEQPQQGTADIVERGPVSLGWDDGFTHPIGGHYNGFTLLSGGDKPDFRDSPDINGYSVFGAYELVSCSGETYVESITCIYDIFQNDSTLVQPDPPYRLRLRDLSNNTVHTTIDRRAGPSSGKADIYQIVNQNDNTDYFPFATPTYPSGNNGQALDDELPESSTSRGRRYAVRNPGACSDTTVTDNGTQPLNWQQVDTEHPIDRSIIPNQFMNFVQTGIIRFSEDQVYTSTNALFQFSSLADNLAQPYDDWLNHTQFPDRPQGAALVEIANALGSTTNPDDMTSLEHNMNSVKGRIYTLQGQATSDRVWRPYVSDLTPATATAALTAVRGVFAVFNYMNQISSQRASVRRTMRDTLQEFDSFYGATFRQRPERMVRLFDEFWLQYDQGIATMQREYVTMRLDDLQEAWDGVAQQDPNFYREVSGHIANLRAKISTEIVLH